MGVNTGTNRSRGGLLVQDNNTTTPEDTVFAYGVREIIVTTGTLTNNGQGTVTITTGGGGGGSGTVTSVTLDADSTGLTISGGTSQTITTSGTFTLAGTLVPTNGGTGMNSYNKGDLIVGGTTNPLETLGTGGRTAGDFLTIKAGLTELEWSSVLPTANGGTGLTSYTKGDIIYADTGGVISELPIGSAGEVLTVSATGIPEWAAGGGGGGSIGGSIADTQIAVGSGTDTISGSSELTFTTGSLPVGSLMDSIITNTTNASPASNSITSAAFTTSGSGTGAIISLGISGATVAEATVTTTGQGYAIGDTITISTSVIGGTTDVVFKLSSTSPATGVEQVLQLAAPEAVLRVQDTTSSAGSRATITLDPSVPNNTGGVAMYWGTDSSPDLYMKLGAFAGANNIDTKSRDFRIFGATGNLMVMDENAQTSGFGNYYAFTTALPTYQLEGGVTNGTTNTTISPVAARRATSGTPDFGIGVGYDFVTQTSAGSNFVLGSQIQSKWASGAAGSENFDLYFNTMQVGIQPPTTRMIIKGDTGDIYVGKAAFIGGSLSGGVGLTVENGNSMLVSGISGGVGIAVTQGSVGIAKGDLTWGGGSLLQDDPAGYGTGGGEVEVVSRICGTVTIPSDIPDGSALDEVQYLGQTNTLEGGSYSMGSAGVGSGYNGNYAGATSTFVSYDSPVTVNLTDISIFDVCVVGGAVSATGFTVPQYEPFTMQVMGKTSAGNLTIQVFGNAVPL